MNASGTHHRSEGRYWPIPASVLQPEPAQPKWRRIIFNGEVADRGSPEHIYEIIVFYSFSFALYNSYLILYPSIFYRLLEPAREHSIDPVRKLDLVRQCCVAPHQIEPSSRPLDQICREWQTAADCVEKLEKSDLAFFGLIPVHSQTQLSLLTRGPMGAGS